MKTIRSMLKHLFLAVPLMLIVSCNSQPPSTLIPHRCENGKFGYVDEKGKEWIEGKYDYAEEFSEDLAVVQVGRYFGYIDSSYSICMRYDLSSCFSNGSAPGADCQPSFFNFLASFCAAFVAFALSSALDAFTSSLRSLSKSLVLCA